MKTEKAIRKQARDTLSNNWACAVAALFIFCGFLLALYLLFESLSYLFDVYNSKGEIKEDCVLTYFLILLAVFIAAIFVTPVKNGFYRYFYSLTNSGDSNPANVFYFFGSAGRYFKTVLFNLAVTGICLLNFAVTLLPYEIIKIIDGAVDLFPTVQSEQIGYTIYSVVYAIGITSGIILSLRLIFIEFLYIDNENMRLAYYFGSKVGKISATHHKDYIILLFSFLPWIILCFLVLPAFYVIPYLTQSIATSSKWLIKLNKDGQKL